MDLTFNSLMREFEQRVPRLELLKIILDMQGFSPPIELKDGDVLSREAIKMAAFPLGPVPILGHGISWKKPLPDGRDFVLCFIAIGTPDPESFSVVDQVDYREEFESLPKPPITKFQMAVMPDDIEAANSTPSFGVIGTIEFDYFMDEITKSGSDPKQAQDVATHFGIQIPQLVNIDRVTTVVESITSGNLKLALEQIKEIGGGKEFQQQFRNIIERRQSAVWYGLPVSVVSTLSAGLAAVVNFRARRFGFGLVDASLAVSSAALATYFAFSAAKPEATRRVVNNLIDRSKKLLRRGTKPPEANP